MIFHRCARSAAVLLVLLVALTGAVRAQAVYQGIRGTLTDSNGAPLVGHRVVFTPAGGGQSFLSQPTRTDGTFVVSLPDGAEVVPVAVLDPRGRRIELTGEAPFVAAEGGQRDVVLPAGTAQAAAGGTATVTGRILDGAGRPLEGWRLVFQIEGGYDVHLSGAGDASGAYSIELPERGLFVPIAALDPRGRRLELPGDTPTQAVSGATRDVQIEGAIPARALPAPPFAGADRLFLAFAEDVPVVDRYRFDVRVDYDDFGDVLERLRARATGAIQFPGLPDVELGVRLGFGDVDPSFGSSESGLTDTEVWGKLRLGPRRGGSDFGFGAVLRLPTGKVASGLGHNGLSTKLFYTERRSLGGAVLAWHAGAEFHEDSPIGTSVVLDGQVAPVGGIAVIFYPGDRVSVVAELVGSGERYDGEDPDVRLLGGVNWLIGSNTHVRGAVTSGLTDGAPDFAVTVGVSFDF